MLELARHDRHSFVERLEFLCVDTWERDVERPKLELGLDALKLQRVDEEG